MPYDVDIGDGADALGQNQLTDALDGTYWVSGWDATLGTGDLEVDIAAGEGAIDGTDVSTGSTQTIDFTGDPDSTYPRKAVIYVDATGTVQKALGTPQPVDPGGEIRFRTYNPSPPASVSGVVVAEVWLAAGETVLESADIRDRRVSNDAVETAQTASLIAGEHVNETSNRSFDTVYQNTTGAPLKAIVTIERSVTDSTLNAQIRVSSDSSPGISDTIASQISESGGEFDEFAVSAIIPDQFYYVVPSQFDATIERWVEQELSIQ